MSEINPIVKKLRENRILNERKGYEEYSRDELITMAQEGDQLAFETLVNTHQDIIKNMSSKYFLDSMDRDDIEQVITIAFWNAVMNWDHTGNFEAYLGMIIKRKMADELRKDDAGKNKINTNSDSLDAPAGTDDNGDEASLGSMLPSKFSTEDEYLGEEGAREIKRFIETNLSDSEREAIKLKIAGYSVSEIAEELDMKYKTVENALMRVKNKLADRMRAQQESKQLKESEVEFSEEEKKILTAAFNHIDESKSLRESTSSELAASYEKMSADEIQDELDSIDGELSEIEEEIRYTDYENRDSLLSKLEKLSRKLFVIEDFLSEEQYEEAEELKFRVYNAEEIEYVKLTKDDLEEYDPWEHKLRFQYGE